MTENLTGSRVRPTAEWDAYRDVHTEIRALDDGGDWDKAVALATGTVRDSANTIFNTFDVRLAETSTRPASRPPPDLSERQPGLTTFAVLALLGGLAAALLVATASPYGREYR